MSPEEEGFWQAILDHPDDDAVRLVYADWLEEQGHTERAEFIRVQCELARPVPEGVDGAPLRDRMRELAAFLERGWRNDFQDVQLETGWNRGILQYIKVENVWDKECVIDRFVRHADQLLALGPVTAVLLLSNIEIAPSTLQQFAASPWVRWLRSLALGGFDHQAAEVLAISPNLDQLTSLTLWCENPCTEGIRVLAETPLLRALTSLHVYCEALGPEVVHFILDSPFLVNVTDLALPGVSRPNLRATGGECFTWSDNHFYPSIGPEGALAVAASPLAARLRRLNIGYNEIGDREALAILHSPYFLNLQELRLGWCKDDNLDSTLSQPVREALIARFGKDVISI